MIELKIIPQMKQLERLFIIYELLKTNFYSYNDIVDLLLKQNIKISKRQIQRDLNRIDLVLQKDEVLHKSKNEDKISTFCISSNIISTEIKNENELYDTGFNTHFKTKVNDSLIKEFHIAILEKKCIKIESILNDVTSENMFSDSKNTELIPIKIIHHRNAYYLGGFNFESKKYQIFEFSQINNFKIINPKTKINFKKLKTEFEIKFEKRFGVTKNIDQNVYKIVLEFSSMTGNYVKKHNWHNSQKFSTKNGCVIMQINCGINRELLGWIFSWMYNVRIIEPPILIDLLKKTVKEIDKTYENNSLLVYKNIF